MRRLPLGLCVAPVIGLLTCGCPQFLPPLEPTVSLFPTVFPVDILDQSSPVDLSTASLKEVIEHAGWQDGFGQFGLSDANLGLLVRGLRKRGYAELDARRAGGSIRWIAFRVLPGAKTLVATAGYDSRPPAAHLVGVDVSAAPTESSRDDAYNYPLRVETWQGKRTNVPMVVEHVIPLIKGRKGHWEIRHLVALQDDTN